MKVIDCEKCGLIDLGEIFSIGRNFLLKEKKYLIFFLTKSGVQNGWQFDSMEDRDRIYNKCCKVLNSINVDKE